MHEASQGMGTDDEAERERLIARYARAEAEFESLGGYAVESQAAAIAASVGLPERVLAQPLRIRLQRVDAAAMLWRLHRYNNSVRPTPLTPYSSTKWRRSRKTFR